MNRDNRNKPMGSIPKIGIIVLAIVCFAAVIGMIISHSNQNKAESDEYDSYIMSEFSDASEFVSSADQENIETEADNIFDYTSANSQKTTTTTTTTITTTTTTASTARQTTTKSQENKIKQLLKSSYWYSEGEGIVVFRLNDDGKLVEYDAVEFDDSGHITKVIPRNDRIFSDNVIFHGNRITISTRGGYLFDLEYNSKKNCFEDTADYSGAIDSPPLDLYKLDL